MELKTNKNFCVLPFTHLSTKPNGHIKLCCRSISKVGDIKKNSLADIWNSDSIREVRKKMLNSERVDMCQPCWDLEDKGILSLRQRMNKNRKHLFWHIKKMNKNFSMPFEIPIIELQLSNLCNLRCRMCKPILSSSWFKDWEKIRYIYESIGEPYEETRIKQKKINYFDQESFFENMKQLGPHLKILEFAGGEPLMEPLHYRALEIVSPWAQNIEVKYATNLSKLKFGQFDIIKKWTKFKSLDLSVSVDGYPELNNYIRTDSKTEELIKNVKTIKNSIKRLSIRGALCFSVYNAPRLPECYDWFTRVLEVPVHGNHVDEPFFLSPKVLPEEIKKFVSKKMDEYIKKVEQGLYSAYPSEWAKRIIHFTSNNQKYMVSDNLYNKYWSHFIDFTNKLDKSRNTNILNILEELTPYFENKKNHYVG